MKRFILRRRASADLMDISAFSEREWGRSQANVYLRRIQQAIENLAETPDMGPACDEIKRDHRRFPIGSHVVFYRKTAHRIEIVRILHQSKDVVRHLK